MNISIDFKFLDEELVIMEKQTWELKRGRVLNKVNGGKVQGSHHTRRPNESYSILWWDFIILKLKVSIKLWIVTLLKCQGLYLNSIKLCEYLKSGKIQS